MKFYEVDNKEMPWGDYGSLLLSGMSNLNENNEKIIERTGPYLPPIYISGLWDLIVSDEVKSQLDISGLTGFELQKIKKGKIVDISWHKWRFESDDPEFYPKSGEPEDYIFEGEHSNMASDAVGNLWIMNLTKDGFFVQEKLSLSEHYDFFIPEGKGIVIVSEIARHWLESKLLTEWIVFKELIVIDRKRNVT